MGDINLKAALGGQIVLTPTNTASNYTATFPAITGVVAVQAAASYTAGSVLFANSSGQIAQNNSQFFWDNTNNRLGIGTASPSAKIHVSGGRSYFFSGDNYSIALAQTTAQGYYAYLGANSSGDFLFSDTSGNTILTLTNNNSQIGNLGLGVTPSAWASPFTKAFEIGTVGSIATTTTSLRFANNAYYGSLGWTYKNTAAAAHYDIIDNTHSWYNAASGTAGAAITFTQAMTLDASGNLGIGTTGPSSKLHVGGNTNGAVLTTIQNSSSGSSAYAGLQFLGDGASFQFAQFSSTTGGGLANQAWLYTNQANSLVLGTSNTARVTIDSSGNVGIGTSSPGCKLDIYAASGSPYMRIYTGTGSVQGYMQAVDNTDARIGTLSNHPFLFITNSTERARFNAGAPILCLSGGNTSATGTGIAFPATQSASSDANTLDDYEEGTFTPTITYQTPGTLSVSYSQQVGKYTKIGNIVKIHIFIVLSAFTKGTASGELRIAGLPFASGASGEEMMTWGAYDTPLPSAAGQFPMAAVNPSNTYMILYYMTNNSTTIANWGDPDANSQYKITGVYLAS